MSRHLPQYALPPQSPYFRAQYYDRAAYMFSFNRAQALTRLQIQSILGTAPQTVSSGSSAPAPEPRKGSRPITQGFGPLVAGRITQLLPDISGPLTRKYLGIQWDIANDQPLYLGFGGSDPIYAVQPGETWFPPDFDNIPQNSISGLTASTVDLTGVILIDVTKAD